MNQQLRRALVLTILALGLAGLPPAPARTADDRRPVRVLLVAGGPTREFQFCRRFWLEEEASKRAELTVLLQRTDDGADTQTEEALKELPADLAAACDVLVAFDPDWLRLQPPQRRGLEEWVRRRGGGLILIPGPVHTFRLAQAVNGNLLKPIRDLFPVELADLRARLIDERAMRYPRQLHFVAKSPPAFLKLDEAAAEPLAGWEEFFSAGQRVRFKEGKPERIAELIQQLDSDEFLKRERAFNELRTVGLPALPALEMELRSKPSLEVSRRIEKLLEYIQLLDVGRGFYDHYPVVHVKPAATLVANIANLELERDLVEQPYLVTLNHGKGRVVYLGSGELWRLRSFRAAYYDRLWRELVRYAANRS